MHTKTLLHSGRTDCAFHTVLICALGESLDPHPSFLGQANDMCGTAVSGRIALTVGLHSGDIHLIIRMSETAPDDIAEWQEVVETPVVFDQDTRLYIVNFDGDPQTEELIFPKGSFRARFSANDYENDQIAFDQPDSEMQHYELVLWPAKPSPDSVLKVTNGLARYVHTTYGGRP